MDDVNGAPDLAKSNKTNADFSYHSNIDDDFKGVESKSWTAVLE